MNLHLISFQTNFMKALFYYFFYIPSKNRKKNVFFWFRTIATKDLSGFSSTMSLRFKIT